MRDEIKVIAEGHGALERRANQADKILKDHHKRLERLGTSATALGPRKKR